MDFAGFVEFVPKFQGAGMPIDHDSNGRAQPLPITQSLLNAGIKPLQIIDHIPNRVALYQKRPLSVCQLAQQRGNPDDWQMVILWMSDC